MPIYEYQCDACGHDMEAIQKMSDAPLSECPACGKPALRRKISAAGFRLKGGGWYETDFKSGNRRNVVGDSANAKGDGATAKGDGASAKAESPKPTKSAPDAGKKAAASS